MIPNGKVAIVSHDAGGAEILSSWLKDSDLSYSLSLSGPAENIFRKKLGAVKNQELNVIIDNSDWVLTGTSWSSDLEYRAINVAKNKNIFVVSYLDHWIHYRERFKWHGPETLPDEIWVGDDEARVLAEKTFSDLTIRLVENPYWSEFNPDFQSKVENRKDRNIVKLLYLSSNIDGIRAKQKTVNYSDRDVWDCFSSKIFKVIDKKKIEKFSIRPHPSENNSKFSEYILDNIAIEINNDENLIDALNVHNCVIGHNSMALVPSSIAGLKTINIINDLPCQLLIPRKYVDLVI